DAVFTAVQALCVVAFVVAGMRSPSAIIVAWGFGALAGSWLGLWQFRPDGALRGGVAFLRSRWHLTRWLSAGALTGWGASQSDPILTGGILGPAGIGGLGAAQSLVTGPANVLLQASGSIALPEASRAWEERGWPGLRRVARLISIAGVATLGLIALTVV